MVTDRQILPPRRGNRVRIVGVVAGLRALGWRVEMICLPHAGSDTELGRHFDAVYRVRGRAFLGGDVRGFDCRPFQWAVERIVAARRPTLVIAEYGWLTPALARLPGSVRRVVDCHDVLHQRTNLFRAAGLDPWVICTADQERALLRHAEVVLAAQNEDRLLLEALLPDRKVVCVFPQIAAPSQPSPTSPSARQVLAVGASHAGNDGILHFAASSWSSVAAAVPDARLVVAGTVTDGQCAAGVTALGEVDDLAPWYARAAVVICPIEVGTGVKIKVVEALRYGKAVVATPAAVQGLPASPEPAWVVARDNADCAQAVTALLGHPDGRVRLERRAIDYAERNFSAAGIQRDLEAALTGDRSARRWLRPLAHR
jgi:succinoglycan biosynthesis protein ExoO